MIYPSKFYSLKLIFGEDESVLSYQPISIIVIQFKTYYELSKQISNINYQFNKCL